jgi:hypothetical protein
MSKSEIAELEDWMNAARSNDGPIVNDETLRKKAQQ